MGNDSKAPNKIPTPTTLVYTKPHPTPRNAKRESERNMKKEFETRRKEKGGCAYRCSCGEIWFNHLDLMDHWKKKDCAARSIRENRIFQQNGYSKATRP